ncbi:hypothetical protein [Micromonospora sp. NPDC093277]|uniref:hypothetical protein n=1 Tax=Micromonospora sp. NPDC093277 TaxID=3364291 RepID=UPI0038216F01
MLNQEADCGGCHNRRENDDETDERQEMPIGLNNTSFVGLAHSAPVAERLTPVPASTNK